MQAAAPLPSLTRADSGFTLLEMLVVLGIAALIAGLLYPQVATASFAVRERMAREQVAAGAEAARAMALRSGAPVALSAADGGRALVIAGSRRIAIDPAGLVRVAVQPQVIVFHPDGSTTGGKLILGSGQRAQTYAIARGTGRLQPAAPSGSGG